jgi:hypothetical protein
MHRPLMRELSFPADCALCLALRLLHVSAVRACGHVRVRARRAGRRAIRGSPRALRGPASTLPAACRRSTWPLDVHTRAPRWERVRLGCVLRSRCRLSISATIGYTMGAIGWLHAAWPGTLDATICWSAAWIGASARLTACKRRLSAWLAGNAGNGRFPRAWLARSRH